MSGWLRSILEKIINLSNSVDNYKKDTVIQSLPSLTYVNRAKKLIEKNKLSDAKKILLKALELPQKDSLVYKYLGVVYEKNAENDAAVECYQISADLSPHDKNIWQRLGFALISTGKYEQAEKSFENADKVQPGNTDTFTGWGMALMKMKKFEDAEKKFETAVSINKYNFSAMFLCAVMEVKLEKYDKAEAKLAFLANVAPNESNTFEYARLKALKDDYASAIHYAQKSLEINSNMQPAYILLGQVYAHNSDKENSLKIFQTAFEKQLISQDLYLEWGKALFKFENYDEAKEKLKKAYEINSENIDIAANLALCCALRNEHDEAEPLIQKVLQIEPDNKEVKLANGILAYQNGDMEKAMSFFRVDDENAVNCYFMAKCQQNLSNDTKVKEYYEAAIEHNNKYVTAFIDYSKYLISKGEYAQAQRKLRKALKIDESNIELLNLMFFTSYTLVKDNICEYNIKETLSVSQKIENINPDLFEYPAQKAELEKLLQKENLN